MMMRTKNINEQEKEQFRKDNFVQCDNCGCFNKKALIRAYGQCHLCKKILDDKAYFEMQMIKKLQLWRKDFIYDKNGNRKTK